MRFPRFFGKKRGHRRTGSQAWASLGDAAFHAVLLTAGIVFAGLLLSGVAVPEWRINQHFLATDCTVLGKGLARRTTAADRGGSSGQPRRTKVVADRAGCGQDTRQNRPHRILIRGRMAGMAGSGA